MSEELIVKHCSPTLAGMKTGNLFTCDFADESELKQSLRLWNRILVKKGLRVLPLRINRNKALIYLFRPSQLSRDLKDKTASCLLNQHGYCCDVPDKCVKQLIKRIGESGDFPHEIGLFLGYPPEDVQGFIENKAGGYKALGVWKVYGDVNKAEKTFAKYRKCTDAYILQLAKGKSVERLALSV